MMPAIRFGAGDLLEYNPKYCVLICRECQYAIQKNALKSHLLRHKIYRRDRQRLLSYIADLNILEPHSVPLPVPGSQPVDSLPVLSGYCCTAEGCRHLTASSKRMRRHWSGVHGLIGSVPFSSTSARPVKLQTFFRGTEIRYFEVASHTVLVNIDDNGDRDDHCEGNGEEDCSATTVVPQAPPPPGTVLAPHGSACSPSIADFNLETMTYFHHFITVTSLTLPGAKNLQSPKQYWQVHVVSLALDRRWLMCGLLAISAHHLAALTDDPTTKRIHRDRQGHLSSEFFAGLSQTTGCDVILETSEIEEETMKTGEQIKCLLRCAEWALADSDPILGCKSVSSSQLLSIISTIRGCITCDSTLPSSGIQVDGHACQEEESIPWLRQTRNSSHGGNLRPSPSREKTPSTLHNRLHELPLLLTQRLGRPENARDVFASLSAIAAIIECCDVSFACNEMGEAWHGVATWLANVPNHFNQMLGRHHPAALVVLAHWAAILVKRAERVGCWFLKGSANIIVLEVARHLSVNGHVVVDLVESLKGIVND